MRVVLSMLLCLFSCETLLASQQKDSLDFTIYFRVGKSAVEPDFHGNSGKLSKIVNEIAHLNQKGMLRRLHFFSSTSPEGGLELNRRLSGRRMQRLYEYVGSRVEIPDSLCEFSSIGVNWDGLSSLVDRSEVRYRSAVLKEFAGRDATYDERCASLMSISRGDAWKDMNRRFFPSLRMGRLVVHYEHPPSAVSLSPPHGGCTLNVPEADVNLIEIRLPNDSLALPKKKCTFIMAVKSNLLYDVALVPNVGVELYLKNNWTIGANWMYAWWKSDDRHRYWRVYGGELYARKYLGKVASSKPFSGHHLGVYAQMLTYDFELGGRGYMGGRPGGDIWDKSVKGAGIEYGYALPVARKLNLDFSLGLGGLFGTCHEYVPVNGHYVWDKTRKISWIGPTRLEVSLVWVLGKGVFNEDK